ncbi:hypothetical protein [Rhizobium halophytocola]|uniref:Uncharacterized protein n=1 Tax=Rhizobium halophytocola TaxID=735519 RepID=A0ABS4DW86_9HYPH|nr:hypothetical protein [Rhizobium halophytocola]MBP1849904.1 hypothetical protein [Rhizobium halophytocola]
MIEHMGRRSSVPLRRAADTRMSIGYLGHRGYLFDGSRIAPGRNWTVIIVFGTVLAAPFVVAASLFL